VDPVWTPPLTMRIKKKDVKVTEASKLSSEFVEKTGRKDNIPILIPKKYIFF
jgi:hypothetical protein